MSSNRFTKGKGLFGTIAVSGATALQAITGTTLALTGALTGTSGSLSGALQAASLKLGGATINDVIYGTLNAVHGTILPGGIGTVTTALAGLAAADLVIANVLTPTADLVFSGVKPGAGTLTTYLTNPTSGTVSPGTFALTYGHIDLE